ncbi:MAG: sll1863 family stress response protein [Candidatus Hodarchaeales archaeon]|jgi:hypothetical protein
MSDDSKKAFIEKPETKIKEWTAKFDKLKEKVDRSETKIKEKYHKGMEDLRVGREDIKKRIQKLKEASGETWRELGSEIEKKWQV